MKTRLLSGASALALLGSAAFIGGGTAHAAYVSNPVADFSGGAFLGSAKTTGLPPGPGTVAGLGIGSSAETLKLSMKATTQESGNVYTQQGPAPITVPDMKWALLGDEGCNQQSDGNLPPSGKVSFTISGLQIPLPQSGFVRITGYDPQGPNYFADVINFHGIVEKGTMAGVDINATLFQTPTVKDKSQVAVPTQNTVPDFMGFQALGYDTNPGDDVAIGQLCQGGGPVDASNILQYNNNMGGAKAGQQPCDGAIYGFTTLTTPVVAPAGSVLTAPATNACVGKPAPIPNRIAVTMVGDGPSLLDPNVPLGVLGPCNPNCAPADGVHLSIY
jgi:hypothetical protein